ncbi:MAG: phosphoribosylformylglycinamidine synthase, partial [Eudoraea sp.]|nr:phosphoribosylformylglycinamidine synthase [Eudoraea sp.]
QEVLSPGTVIISAAAHCSDVKKVVEPVFKKRNGSIYYINFSQDSFALGGSSFAQSLNKVGDNAPTIRDAEYFRKTFNTLQELIKEEEIVAGHDVASGGLITTLLEMCFADNQLGAQLDLSSLGEKDTTKLLFAENAAVVIQARSSAVEKVLKKNKIEFYRIGSVVDKPELTIINGEERVVLDVYEQRDLWFKTSYLLDQKQTSGDLAKQRYQNYKNQPLIYRFPEHFQGKLPDFQGSRPKAAILREKGSNSEREMANSMFLAGFDVKDVHMTDLISGRETLEDIQFIGAVGGFSNSDVLGSAKGWAGAFKYNEKAQIALQRFFSRPDTLSVGICNGCQLFMELELINPEHEVHGKMTYNDSHKHESNFTSVCIEKNNSVMLASLEGSTLGVWISHGEGKFSLPYPANRYGIVATYGYDQYPANPNGSDYNVAMLCDPSGRHLVTMPHIERSIFPWNWAHYPSGEDEVSPWLEAFVNARKWLENR